MASNFNGVECESNNNNNNNSCHQTECGHSPEGLRFRGDQKTQTYLFWKFVLLQREGERERAKKETEIAENLCCFMRTVKAIDRLNASVAATHIGCILSVQNRRSTTSQVKISCLGVGSVSPAECNKWKRIKVINQFI